LRKEKNMDGNEFMNPPEEDGEYAVRRLLPCECAALQGFPKDWCDDVPHSDSAEYKLWGNGIALPSILGIIQNAVNVLKEETNDGSR
jgi:DNA (cytosine-5)-methyltransferase 1